LFTRYLREFHDFAGSVVMHTLGGWIALPAVVLLGARSNRYRKNGVISAHPPSSIPFLALGAWVLTRIFHATPLYDLIGGDFCAEHA
jgi:ammonia channel protein AmtB